MAVQKKFQEKIGEGIAKTGNNKIDGRTRKLLFNCKQKDNNWHGIGGFPNSLQFEQLDNNFIGIRPDGDATKWKKNEEEQN